MEAIVQMNREWDGFYLLMCMISLFNKEIGFVVSIMYVYVREHVT